MWRNNEGIKLTQIVIKKIVVAMEDLLAYLTAIFLITRVYFLMKIDEMRNKKTLIKFFTGAYAFEAIFPLLLKPLCAQENRVVKMSNLCLIAFYFSFAVLLFTIWFKHV